jgi:hypothetical protein
MAGDPENLLQARPCIPLLKPTLQNRPRTPPAARTRLQAAIAPRRPSCCAEPPPPPKKSRASADGQKLAICRDTARPYTRPALPSVSVVPRNALAARGEPLLAAPGTCETAMRGSTDTAGGRGAELLGVTYPNQGAGK